MTKASSRTKKLTAKSASATPVKNGRPSKTQKTSRSTKVATRRKGGNSSHESDVSAQEESSEGGDSDVYEEENDGEAEDDDVASLHSDNLDDSDFDSKSKKRKRGPVSSSPRKKVTVAKPNGGKKSPAKKKSKKVDEDEEEDLEDGQEVVGVVVQAPKTGRGALSFLMRLSHILNIAVPVPPGQISQNTLNFLEQLKDPECNDRVWFKLHGIFVTLSRGPPVDI